MDIKTNGILEPIKYVESGGAKLLVDGHHRLKISKELGMKTIPSQKVNLPYKGYKTSKDLEYSFD
jgi:ParB-like chromosome segregation protein Spo0J